MNQIRRKRRLSALEAAVLGNSLYIVIVLIFKNVFDVIRTSNFNFLFNSIQLLTVGVFWITLFMICFKNISGNEKPKAFKYILYSLIPIIVLTVTLSLVSIFIPGQDTNSIWNQFTFLAAPTIFWYLPFGLIYQLIGNQLSIFAFFGISIMLTIVFQILGIVLGRIVGRKYAEETKAEDQRDLDYDLESKKSKKKSKKKSRLPKNTSIGMEGLSNAQINEGFTPEEPETMNMTEVIFQDVYENERLNTNNEDRGERPVKQRRGKQETGLFERIPFDETQKVFTSSASKEPYEIEIKPAAMPDLEVNETVKTEQPDTIDEWKLTHPIGFDKVDEDMKKHQETEDKSFLMETSAVRIINEEDIEEYYRNKK